MYSARTETAAIMTGSSLRSRLTVRFMGMSGPNLETAFSHWSQFVQLGLRQRGSTRATRSTASVHSAVSYGVRQDSNPATAKSLRTPRASPPRQPMPETTTELSKTARGLPTPLLFDLFDNIEDGFNRFGLIRTIPIKLLKSF